MQPVGEQAHVLRHPAGGGFEHLEHALDGSHVVLFDNVGGGR
jgi:hypothetical protein